MMAAWNRCECLEGSTDVPKIPIPAYDLVRCMSGACAQTQLTEHTHERPAVSEASIAAGSNHSHSTPRTLDSTGSATPPLVLGVVLPILRLYGAGPP